LRIVACIAGLGLLLGGCGAGGGSTAAAPPAELNTSLLPHIKRCPRSTGRLSGITLGRVHLGMTRSEAKHAYTRSTERATPYEDFFCLTPIGVRVAYPSPALLRTLTLSEQQAFSGRVIWASTADRRYSVDGLRPGAKLARARRLHPIGPIQVGANSWYFAPAGPSTAVLKVRRGRVEEVGIAEPALTGGIDADAALIRSLPPIAEGS
jgi:hypothetical protein